MSEVRDPSVPDDTGSPAGTGVAPARCIVSRGPFRSGVFVATLRALSPHDKLEIIVDRRRGGSAMEPPSIERRRQSPHCAHALERVGFAVIPTRAAQPAESGIPAALPIERLDPPDADTHRFERILEYQRRRKGRRNRWVFLAGLMGVLVLLVLVPEVQTLMSRARLAARPPSADRMNPPSAVAPGPQAAETPSSKPSSATATTTRPVARIRPTLRAVDTSASSPLTAERQAQPRVTQDEATAPELPSNDADDPRTVIDWLLKSIVDTER